MSDIDKKGERQVDAADYERWASLIELDGLVVGSDDSVRFTSKRKDELTELFGMAGIDIRDIRTKGQYLRAREQAKEHFMPFLERRAREGTMTTERRLLLAVLDGDKETAEVLERKLMSKRGKKLFR